MQYSLHYSSGTLIHIEIMPLCIGLNIGRFTASIHDAIEKRTITPTTLYYLAYLSKDKQREAYINHISGKNEFAQNLWAAASVMAARTSFPGLLYEWAEEFLANDDIVVANVADLNVKIRQKANLAMYSPQAWIAILEGKLGTCFQGLLAKVAKHHQYMFTDLGNNLAHQKLKEIILKYVDEHESCCTLETLEWAKKVRNPPPFTVTHKIQITIPEGWLYVRKGKPLAGENYIEIREETHVVYVTSTGVDRTCIVVKSKKEFDDIAKMKEFVWPDVIAPGTWLWRYDGQWLISMTKPIFNAIDNRYVTVPGSAVNLSSKLFNLTFPDVSCKASLIQKPQ